MKQFKKGLWAVDNHTQDNKLQEHCLYTLKALMPEVSVEPVCVLTPAQIIKEHAGFTDLLNDLRTGVERELSEWIGGLDVKNLSAPRVLMEEKFSVRKAVEALVRYATESEADFIAVSTHARKGLKRVLLGSFAETLLLVSPIPVLAVNPQSKVPDKVGRVLCPTDFMESSKLAFQTAIDFCVEHKAELVLFHQLEYLNESTAPTFSYSPMYARYLEEDLAHRKEEGALWVEQARSQGVKASLHLNDTGGFAVDGIIKDGMRADLIVMTATTGPVGSLVLGSVTRQVLRETTDPVLVLHAIK